MDKERLERIYLVDQLLALERSFLQFQIHVGSSKRCDAVEGLRDALNQIVAAGHDLRQTRYFFIAFNEHELKNTDIQTAVNLLVSDDDSAEFTVLRPCYMHSIGCRYNIFERHGYEWNVSVFALRDGFKSDPDPRAGYVSNVVFPDPSNTSDEEMEATFGGMLNRADFTPTESTATDIRPEPGLLWVVYVPRGLEDRVLDSLERVMKSKKVLVRAVGGSHTSGLGGVGVGIFSKLNKVGEPLGMSPNVLYSPNHEGFKFYDEGISVALLRVSVRIETDLLSAYTPATACQPIWVDNAPGDKRFLTRYCKLESGPDHLDNVEDSALDDTTGKQAEDANVQLKGGIGCVTGKLKTWMRAVSGRPLPIAASETPTPEEEMRTLRHTIMYPLGYKMTDTGDPFYDYAPVHIKTIIPSGLKVSTTPMPLAGLSRPLMTLLSMGKDSGFGAVRRFGRTLNKQNFELLPHGVGTAGTFANICAGYMMHMTEGSLGVLADPTGIYRLHAVVYCSQQGNPFMYASLPGEIGYNPRLGKNMFGNLMLAGASFTRTPLTLMELREAPRKSTTSLMSFEEGTSWDEMEVRCHNSAQKEMQIRRRFLLSILSSKFTKLPKKEVLQYIFGAKTERSLCEVRIKILFKTVLYSPNPVDQALSVAAMLLSKSKESHLTLDRRLFCSQWSDEFGDMAVGLLSTWEHEFDTGTAGEWGLEQVMRGIDRGSTEVHDERVLAHPTVSNRLQEKWNEGYWPPRYKFFSDMFAYICYMTVLTWREFSYANGMAVTGVLLLWSISLLADDIGSASFRWNSTFAVMDLLMALGYIASLIVEGQNGTDSIHSAELIKAAVYVVAWARCIKYLLVNESFGPVWVMIQLVVMELIRLGAIIMIFFAGVTVALTSANRNEESEEVKSMFGSFGSSVISVFMYATAGFESVDRDWWDSIVVYIFSQALLILFTLMVAILLLNLFIAMLTSTYERIQQVRDRQWLVLFAFMAIEYEKKGPFPAPLNICNFIRREARLRYERSSSAAPKISDEGKQFRIQSVVASYERSVKVKVNQRRTDSNPNEKLMTM